MSMSILNLQGQQNEESFIGFSDEQVGFSFGYYQPQDVEIQTGQNYTNIKVFSKQYT